ncbi:MAG: fused MFS/spermidine synthase, partial [Myxococcota bacterium]
ALYAVLEVGIGITSLLVPLMVEPIKWAYIGASVVDSAALLIGIKFVLSVAVMLIPTTLMGLTLPVLVEACVDPNRPAEGTQTVGYLYGFNTAGAAIGCLLVGFVFLYLFGITATVTSIAGLNFAVAAVAYLAYGRQPLPERATPAPRETRREPSPKSQATALLFVYAMIGVVSLGYEVAWFRVLVFYLQSATYSFSILLATYLVGLALGSLTFSRLLEPRLTGSSAFGVTVKWIAIGQILLALMTSCTLVLSKATIPIVWSALISVLGADSWTMIATQKICIAAVIVIPPTFIMGATFPMIVKLYKASGASDASSVAHLYAANTAGAVIGSVVTGFVLFDLLGMQQTLSILSFVSLCIGLGILIFFRSHGARSRLLRTTVGLLVGGWILVLAFQPPRLVESLIEDTRGVDVIFSQESAADITMVGESDSGRELIYHDGRGTCATWPIANYVARQLAYSSMAQNPGAVDILIISMGCGNTASAFTAFPIESLDIVDLSPSVFDAARYFELTNLGVMKDPRVTAISDDGRNYLLTTRKQYDIIQIELPSIHTAGVVSLYTREFYEIARAKLKP